MSFKFIQKIINALRLHLSKDVLWEHYKKYKELEDIKNDGKLEGKREGILEGEVKTLYELTRDGIITKEIAANKLNITVEKFEKDMKAYFNK